MQNGKSPGNDKYSEDFYGTFWNDTKKTFLWPVKKAYEIQRLSPSQKQAVINLTKKKGEIKTLQKVENNLFANVDTKLVSKALSECSKNVLPCIFYKSQTTCINKRIISEEGGLTDDFLEICNI